MARKGLWSGPTLPAALIALYRLVMFDEAYGENVGSVIFGDKVEVGDSGRVKGGPQ